MISFILQNTIIALNSCLISRKYFSFRGTVEAILSFFVLSYAQIILILTFLGSAGQLYLKNVILSEVIILLFLTLTTAGFFSVPSFVIA